jgi:hypothetical protein
MPNPTQSDLHINVPLTNVSIGYMINRRDFIADKVFPACPGEQAVGPVLEVPEVGLASH